jgi:MoxR-like ATPase
MSDILDKRTLNKHTLEQDVLDDSKLKIAKLKANISTVLIGQDTVLEQVIIAFLAGGHVLLEGVPGLGKTLLIRALADSI